MPIPPAWVTSSTGPSPKLNVTLLTVPSGSLPFAVKVTSRGAVPDILSAVSLSHLGTWFVDVVGWGVDVGVVVADGVAVGALVFVG